MFKPSSSLDHLVDAAFSKRVIAATEPATPSVDISVGGNPTPRSDHDAAMGAQATTAHRVETAAGTFWIQGDVVLCACPDCSAPMTVRVWIGLADCWRCDCCLQLTADQQAAVEQALESHDQPELLPDRPVRSKLAVLDPVDPVSPFETASPFNLQFENPSDNAAERELAELTAGSSTARLLRRAFSMTPAWLISMLVHVILLLILAMLVFSTAGKQDAAIVLSTFVDNDRKEGGEIRIENLENELVDDLRNANNMEMSDQELRNVVQEAQADAQDLLKDTKPRESITELKRNITTQQGPLNSFAARDPRVRAEIVKKEGGTTLTEAAVARGLRWLASVQNDDGGWSLGQYNRSNVKGNPSDTAATALALLPFLGAGQTHESGIYRENVAKGLSWLISKQESNGDLRAGSRANLGMYAHGQATIVMSEAFALTGDQKLSEPTQLAIDFIQEAQHPKGGGWRYKPGDPGDTSVLGWQVMALYSAKAPNIGVEVDEDVLNLADYYLDRAAVSRAYVRQKDLALSPGSLYNYMPGRNTPTKTMTAEAILCRLYLGWKRDDPRVIGAVNWLIKNHPPDQGKPNLYYWYYGTQVMHHFGGAPWKKWNPKMRDLLVESQEEKGRNAGSWDPRPFQWGSRGERIYVTSLAVCTLEVYYRHLPLFKPIELE